MALTIEDTGLRRAALAYVIEIYDELTEENGAPTLGVQNQAVEYILRHTDLREATAAWEAHEPIDEASTAPPRRLRHDALYHSVRAFMEEIMGPPIFAPC